jgi:hypothetical protein
MAIAWVLCDKRVTSALIGAHSVEQLDNLLDTTKKLQFTNAELNQALGPLRSRRAYVQWLRKASYGQRIFRARMARPQRIETSHRLDDL